jgi:hypothetical protein
MRDVLALAELVTRSDGATPEEHERAAQDAKVILDNTDLRGCLLAALGLLNGAWRQIAAFTAASGGPSEEEALALLLREYRSRLS